MNPTRRNFFYLADGAMLAAQDPQNMISRAARPEDDYLTPVDKFFVRTHVCVPSVDLNDWRLEIGGVVDKPVTLTMENLHRMPVVEMVAVVECVGNGRFFFDPPVPGLQWSTGGCRECAMRREIGSRSNRKGTPPVIYGTSPSELRCARPCPCWLNPRIHRSSPRCSRMHA